MYPGQKNVINVIAKLTFPTELKKDFREVQDSIIKGNEAYDHYCALKTAQQSVVKFDGDLLALAAILDSLEKLREYFQTIMLLDFLNVSVITLNKVESGIYINALHERLSTMKVKLSDDNLDKETVQKLRDEVEFIKIK